VILTRKGGAHLRTGPPRIPAKRPTSLNDLGPGWTTTSTVCARKTFMCHYRRPQARLSGVSGALEAYFGKSTLPSSRL
jgi:hypothetical protein